MSHAIEIRDLHYRAGKAFEIRDLAVNVPTGAMYGFLGPNGAGKTTTIRLMLGLLRPLRGTITVLGGAIPREAPRVLARTGYVPEQPHLYQSLTVDEAIRFHSAFYPASETASGGCGSPARRRWWGTRRSCCCRVRRAAARTKRGLCVAGKLR